jgi:hypothetical protein
MMDSEKYQMHSGSGRPSEHGGYNPALIKQRAGQIQQIDNRNKQKQN